LYKGTFTGKYRKSCYGVDGRVRFPSLRQFLEWGLNSLGGTGVQSESAAVIAYALPLLRNLMAGEGTAFAHAKHKFLLFHMPSPCKALFITHISA